MIDGARGYYEAGENGAKGKKLKKAEITLNDCLACSGCITSAESVLVSMQSHEEVYRVLGDQPVSHLTDPGCSFVADLSPPSVSAVQELTPILSISPQTLASLAALYDLSMPQTLRGLRAFFKATLGFRLAFDTTFARSLALAESRAEFVERRAHAATAASPFPSPAALAASALSPASSSTGPLPVLSSSCPGWICYAEKTHGELLPFVSNAKSPQAVMGTLVKAGEVAARLGLRPEEIYHVSVMPCYDKKLEASRPDFATAYAEGGQDVRDVDCVLTTGEVAKMLDDKGLNLRDLALAEHDPSGGAEIEGIQEDQFLPSLLYTPGTSSGGALHNTIRAVVASLPEVVLYHTSLEEKRVRSDDYVEFKLVSSAPEDGTKSTLLHAAKCYGFRNLQNVVRKLGKDAGVAVTKGAAGKMPASAAAAAANARRLAANAKRSGTTTPVGEPDRGLEFVEVMACPGGCVNGGGQINPPKTSARERQRIWAGVVDTEGMPEVGETMDRSALEAQAEEGEEWRVLSAKEWVAKVESTYWGGRDPSAPCADLAKPAPLDLERIHPSLRPYVHGEAGATVDALQRRVVDGLVGGGGEERRRELFRTSYRRVESEEVNGLAVVW